MTGKWLRDTRRTDVTASAGGGGAGLPGAGKGSEGTLPRAPSRGCLTLTLARITLWTSRSSSSASGTTRLTQDQMCQPGQDAVL